MKRKLLDLFCYAFLIVMTLYLVDMFVTELAR